MSLHSLIILSLSNLIFPFLSPSLHPSFVLYSPVSLRLSPSLSPSLSLPLSLSLSVLCFTLPCPSLFLYLSSLRLFSPSLPFYSLSLYLYSSLPLILPLSPSLLSFSLPSISLAPPSLPLPSPSLPPSLQAVPDLTLPTHPRHDRCWEATKEPAHPAMTIDLSVGAPQVLYTVYTSQSPARPQRVVRGSHLCGRGMFRGQQHHLA